MAAQVLPLGQSHFVSYPQSAYSPEMFPDFQCKQSPYTSNLQTLMLSAYPVIQDESFAGYQTDASGQPFIVSPRALSTSESQRRASAHSPSIAMRQPPARNRTPIQHHRTSVSRARSRSRSEMLLAFATETQVSQPPSQAAMTVVPSQSAPTTPQIFPMQSYGMQHGLTEGYSDPSSYFPASMTPVTSPQIPAYPYQQASPQFENYYPVSRSASHSAVAALSALNPQETMYMSTPDQQPLPSMSATGHSFPPIHQPLESSPGDLEIMSSRPKPQCWDHGCNGRQFSTFSNLPTTSKGEEWQCYEITLSVLWYRIHQDYCSEWPYVWRKVQRTTRERTIRNFLDQR